MLLDLVDEAFDRSAWHGPTLRGALRGKDDVRLLVEEHKKLRAAIGAFPPRALNRRVDEKGQTAAYTIRGIAAHDLYHAGQVQLLKRLQHGRRPPTSAAPASD